MISKIISILFLVLNYIQSKLKAKKNEKLQKEVDKIEKNPKKWLSDHFDGGVCTSKKSPNKTSKTTNKRD